MTEENVTISILSWLELKGWKIVSFDFPQSGSGFCLQPNKVSIGSKNMNTIIPDIVAFRNGVAIYFENKTDYWHSDFQKVHDLKTTGSHSESLKELLSGFAVKETFYGIGLHAKPENIRNGLGDKQLIDFLLTVKDDLTVKIHYDPHHIFI
jgi:hypothetical protein